MLIALRNVLSPTVNELFHRALNVNPATQLLVFRPKRDALLPDVDDAMLRDGWPPHITASVTEEMLFGVEGLNFDAPPTFFLIGEHGSEKAAALLEAMSRDIYRCHDQKVLPRLSGAGLAAAPDLPSVTRK